MDIKAIPTEYRGIVFRSKSEALMARSFDLNPVVNINWNYEPPQFTNSEGWTPDFFVVMTEATKTSSIPRIYPLIIEYKPSQPTQTYIKKLEQRFDWINGRDNFNLIRELLIFGSFFDENKPRGCFVYKRGKWYDTHMEPVFCRWESAKHYRFDLEGGGR